MCTKLVTIYLIILSSISVTSMGKNKLLLYSEIQMFTYIKFSNPKITIFRIIVTYILRHFPYYLSVALTLQFAKQFNLKQHERHPRALHPS